MQQSWILSRPYETLTGSGVAPPAADAPLPPQSMRLADFVAGLEAIRATSADPLVSWRQGQALDPRDLGPVGAALARAPDLGSALRCLAHGFPALQSGTAARFEVEGDRARFVYRVLDSRLWPRRADSELTLGFVMALAERCGAPAGTARISFEHDACGRTAVLAGALRGAPQMGAAENAITLPARMLDRPLAGTGGGFQDGLRALDRAMAELRRRQRLSARVRDAILTRMGNDPIDQDAIASLLGLSRRSLRRHLAAEGTSFQEVLEDCRRACGYAMLTRGSRPLSDIALSLGYADQTAFSRAFSRWFGESPRDLRRSGGQAESVIR